MRSECLFLTAICTGHKDELCMVFVRNQYTKKKSRQSGFCLEEIFQQFFHNLFDIFLLSKAPDSFPCQGQPQIPQNYSH